MDNRHIAFLYCSNNDMFHAQQKTCLISSTTPTAKRNGVGDIKSGNGFYIYKTPTDSIRRSIALFCVRSLPKHTWINSNNVFIGRENE